MTRAVLLCLYSLAVANGMSALMFSNNPGERDEDGPIEKCLGLMMNGCVKEAEAPKNDTSP